MILDLIYLLVLVLAVWRGARQGLIVGLFSLLAVIIGLAAALKFSILVAGWLGTHTALSREWLPLIAFAGVLIVVVILVRLMATSLKQMAQALMLGWADRIGGIALFVIIYTLVYSVILFYAVEMKIILPETTSHSVTYSFIKPFAPSVLNAVGSVIPLFKDLFIRLQEFFGGVATQIQH